jgi:hypothetical protein
MAKTTPKAPLKVLLKAPPKAPLKAAGKAATKVMMPGITYGVEKMVAGPSGAAKKRVAKSLPDKPIVKVSHEHF